MSFSLLIASFVAVLIFLLSFNFIILTFSLEHKKLGGIISILQIRKLR